MTATAARLAAERRAAADDLIVAYALRPLGGRDLRPRNVSLLMASRQEGRGTVQSGGASQAFAAAHARLVKDTRFQFEFAPYVEPKPPAWLKGLAKILRFLGPVAPYLFWGAVAVVVIGLLVAVGRELLRLRGAALGPAKVLHGGDFAPSRRRAQALLAEADRLAGEGLYGEAVRVLLFRTLDDIEQRHPGLVGPAQTSREIAALTAIPAAARSPLARIAAAVERFVFAGRVLDAAAFRDCRADYDAFLSAAAA